MKTTEFNICYASDNNYAPYLGIAMLSVIQTHPHENIHFYILDNGISEKNKIKLRAMMPTCYQLDFIPVSEDLFESYHISQKSHFTAAIFYRLKIPELLGHLDRVLYLDVDTLVRGNLRPFYDMEMEDKCFGMIKDVIEEWHCNRVHLPAYYNSGVILFNIKACQQKNIVQQLLDGCLLYPNSKFPDQDIINIVGKEDIVSASFIYNAQILSTSSQSINFFNNNMKEIKILHYVGEQKPWSIKGNPFELFYFQIWIKSLWKKDLHLLMFKRYRRFLFAQVKMDGVKTNYILGIPVMRRQRKGNNKTVWILGMKVLEKKVKIKYIQDEGMH